jgi:release factor glutamine methyltransferase
VSDPTGKPGPRSFAGRPAQAAGKPGPRSFAGRPAQAAYPSTLTAEQAERIRRWHEDAYRAASATAQTYELFGRSFEVPPQVQPINPMSDLLGGAVLAEARPGDRVLDMGTGSGVNAILAAGAATDVLAVDINPRAIEAARRNAERNGVADRIEVRASDVFDAVDGDFDLIVFDPPFRWFAPRDLFETALTDENYGALTRFFRQCDGYLRTGGRMLVLFGTSGDLGYLRTLIAETGFRFEIVAHRSLERPEMTVDYYTHRITRT